MKQLSIFLFAGFLAFTACAPTAKIVKSWRDPGTTVDASKLYKLVVFAPVKDDAQRRKTEDKLVEVLKGKAVASYKIIPDPSSMDQNAVMQKLSEGGFDGALVMRLVAKTKELSYVPGEYPTYPTYFGSYWGYYTTAWATFQEPGYFTEDQTYFVETNLYDLKKDKLVWSGVTSTVDPGGLSSTLNDIVWAVHNEMVKDGFLVNEK